MTTDEAFTDIAAVRDWKDDLEEVVPSQGSWTEEEYLVLTSGRKRPVEYTDGNLDFLPGRLISIRGCLDFCSTRFTISSSHAAGRCTSLESGCGFGGASFGCRI